MKFFLLLAALLFSIAFARYTGVNLAGGEFDSGIAWPKNGDIDYFWDKGFKTFRIPFKWERIQPTLSGSLNASHLNELTSLVNYATSKGAIVILDCHNYARYKGVAIGSGTTNAQFADLWTRLANTYKSNCLVWFGLMNEPHSMSTNVWVSAANAAIQAIVATGATNKILVCGNGWSGAHSWTQNWYDTASTKVSNSAAMLSITGPASQIVFEAHQYFDGDKSGTSSGCTYSTTTQIAEVFDPFVNWLNTNNKKGFIGEFGAGTDANCQNAITNTLNYLASKTNVLGWTWWAAGSAWPSDYFTSIQPKPSTKIQEAWLIPKLDLTSYSCGPTAAPTTLRPTTKAPTAPVTTRPPTSNPPTASYTVSWNSGCNTYWLAAYIYPLSAVASVQIDCGYGYRAMSQGDGSWAPGAYVAILSGTGIPCNDNPKTATLRITNFAGTVSPVSTTWP